MSDSEAQGTGARSSPSTRKDKEASAHAQDPQAAHAVVVAHEKCAMCGGPVPAPKKRGRPRIFCSDACRYKAGQQNLRVKRPVSLRSLPVFAKDAGWLLRKDVQRLERIFADDRFPVHKQQMAAHLRGHLKYAAEVCQDLLSQLDEMTGA